MSDEPTVGSLFSGIGGFDLGFERAGWRTAWFCEQEAFCQLVLRRHWPDVPIYHDVRRIDGDHVAPVDVLCGGFPCQDLSVAGRGAGLQGERSGLWSEFRRLIGELRPRYVVVENVSALLARGLGIVLGDLAALRYDTEWACIRASDVGAPHRRDRVWLVAYPQCDALRDQPGRRDGQDRAGQAVAGDDGQDGHAAHADSGRLAQHPQRDREPQRGVDGPQRHDALRRGQDDAADPECEGLQGDAGAGNQGAWRPAGVAAGGGADVAYADLGGRLWWPRVFGPGWWRELEDCGWWGAQPGVRRVDDGLSAGLDGDWQVVSVVREGADAQALFEWAPGGQGTLREAEVLRYGVSASGPGRSADDEPPDDVLEVAQAPQGGLRALRGDGPPPCPSPRREHHEQRGEQPRDAVRGVPQPPPLAAGRIPNRPDRIKALGNALVPQIAELIAHRINAYEASLLQASHDPVLRP